MRMPRLTKSVAVMALAAGALLAPAATTTASAMPPCCGIDLVANYYATADMTGPVVGQRDDGGDCAFTPWGEVTDYVKYTRIYCSTSVTS
jgi:hypothetical protein